MTGHGDIILLQPLDFETEDLYLFHVHATDGRMVSAVHGLLPVSDAVLDARC